jgi:hypothetical protein
MTFLHQCCGCGSIGTLLARAKTSGRRDRLGISLGAPADDPQPRRLRIAAVDESDTWSI